MPLSDMAIAAGFVFVLGYGVVSLVVDVLPWFSWLI